MLVSGVPKVLASGQGGLLDVALAPDYATSNRIFFSFSEEREDGNGTSVASARLVADEQGGGALEDVSVIFRQTPKFSGRHHFGSRLAFAPDGRLFVTLGERNSERARAQTLDSQIGKVVRIERDGSVPADNPFIGRAGAMPEIWSYGHRNIQGAALHPGTGELWTNEHGPKGGDELNIITKGANYGWPKITYGVNYDGTVITEATEADGMQQPETYWVPSIAPSGMAFLTSARYGAAWQGSLFIGSLKFGTLHRLEVAGGKVQREEKLLQGNGERIRDVRQGPDGLLYMVTDSPQGRLLRLQPN